MRLKSCMLIAMVASYAVGACTTGSEPMHQWSPSVDFATRYAAAWSSHSSARIASFYSETGWLAINGETPSVGRQAIADAAQSFVTAYPDLIVFERLEPKGEANTLPLDLHWDEHGTGW